MQADDSSVLCGVPFSDGLDALPYEGHRCFGLEEEGKAAIHAKGLFRHPREATRLWSLRLHEFESKLLLHPPPVIGVAPRCTEAIFSAPGDDEFFNPEEAFDFDAMPEELAGGLFKQQEH